MTFSQHNICEYCHTKIKSPSEVIFCSRCNTPYHKDCFDENGGCAVYGCDNTIGQSNLFREKSFNDVLVDIEFLINEKRFVEAIEESKRNLCLDRHNTELKKLYNRAVSLVNAKTKLIEEGDRLYDESDFENAGIFYRRALNYCNDVDGSIINARLEIIKYEIPRQLKRKRVSNSIALLLGAFVILLIAGLYYYFVAMEQPKEFAKIERDDNPADVIKTELQISRYENFARKYQEGEWYYRAVDKVSYFSAMLAEVIYEIDWRSALNFLKKIDKDRSIGMYSDLDKKIFEKALLEYSEKVKNAKLFNSQKNYTEAKYSLQSAMDVLDYYKSNPEMGSREMILADIDLLNEKISKRVKHNAVIKEIEEKTNELVRYSETPVRGSRYLNTVIISGRVLGVAGNGIHTVRSESSRKVLGVNTGSIQFSVGDYVSLECIKKGSLNYIDDNSNSETIPLYEVVLADGRNLFTSLSEYEISSIEQRLSYLKGQKIRLDSLMSVKLRTK